MGKTITAGFISDTINGIGINSSIKCNNDNLNNNTSRSVAYVVMHYTGNSKDTAKASTCKVTAVNTKGTHPYHCISQDGKGVYGWVNAADVK